MAYPQNIATANRLIAKKGGDIDIVFQGERTSQGAEVTPDTTETVKAVVLPARSMGRGISIIANTEIKAGDKYVLIGSAGLTKDLQKEMNFDLIFDNNTWRKISCDKLSPDSSSTILYELIVRI